MDTRFDKLLDAFGALNLRMKGKSKPALSTSAVSIVSHTHGRERREQRGIDKRELQQAVLYGRKERANPGRDGKPRWRYTHKGVVYVTDETSRHEITSWRLEDAFEAPPPPLAGAGAGTSHVIVIVDNSGSMRKNDVPGYDSRTAAVYDCLARELVEPQLRVTGGSRMEVSLIEMQDDASVLFERCAADDSILSYLKARANSRARSHGNYLPALEAALRLMVEDAACQKQLFLVFLSDGAPSDHTEMACSHGYQVWRQSKYGGTRPNGKQCLQNCPVSNACRHNMRNKVKDKCFACVRRMGDLLGRDRVSINTVAFGPAAEDFAVLQGMAKVLPRGSFQKLGLSVNSLRTAFTSLTSDLTTLRTEAGAGGGLTLRSDIATKAERQEYDEHAEILDGEGWDVYTGANCKAKQRYDPHSRRMVNEPYADSETFQAWQREYPYVRRGIAHGECKFAEGAERVVYQCTEVMTLDGGETAYAIGPRLVAKQSRYEEHKFDPDFHRTFCRTQGEAEDLAGLFNRRLAGGPAMQVHFLPCFVYTIVDQYYAYSSRGIVEVLVEAELEGKFTKWNNNNGGVARGARGMQNSLLGAIVEEDEEEGEEEVESGGPSGAAATYEDVPQAFSHFTWDNTAGQKLVCDLQGVWNSTDGFTLTDPVIHHVRGHKHNGATDKGQKGISDFFATHTCNALCRKLGLRQGPKN